VINQQAQLAHHLLKITVADAIAAIPAHAYKITPLRKWHHLKHVAI
jgi:hypothetical protein